MGDLCLFNLKKFDKQFDEFADLTKDVTNYCLANNFGALFCPMKCGNDRIIAEEKMTHYFFLSDSFLYYDYDFLDTTRFVNDSKEQFKKHFFETFKFFEELLDVVFKYDIDIAEVWIDEWFEATEADDFYKITAEKESFLQTLYDFFIEKQVETGHTFPPVVIEVKNARIK